MRLVSKHDVVDHSGQTRMGSRSGLGQRMGQKNGQKEWGQDKEKKRDVREIVIFSLLSSDEQLFSIICIPKCQYFMDVPLLIVDFSNFKLL